MPNSELVRSILARGAIAAEDIRALRHRVFWKGVVTEADAEAVFVLNDRLGASAAEGWPDVFVETLTDYLVNQAEPAGYVSEANAGWLIERISRSGHVDTEAELELLVKVLERAKSSPVALVAFALEQVKRGVLEGQGPVGRGLAREPGIVDEAETELVRRILYAFGGDGNIAITRQEAAILIDINDATAEVDNHPAWSDLFVKALANFFMAASGYQVPSRQEALRREAWLDEPTAGVGAFMGRMLTGSLTAVWDAYRHGSLDGEPAAQPAWPDVPLAPRITEDEVSWAAARLRRDGLLHENEMALINFLKAQDAHLHPRLLPILDLVA